MSRTASFRSVPVCTAALAAFAGLAAAAPAPAPAGAANRPARPAVTERSIELRALLGPVTLDQHIADPANAARLSRVYRVQNGQAKALATADLNAIDGDRTTDVTLAEGESLELRFIGAARFISDVAVDSTADSVAVEFLSPLGEWLPFGEGKSGAAAAPVRARGLRITPRPGKAGVTTLRDVSARFEQADPDALFAPEKAAVYDYFYEWCEDYSNTSDLSVCSEETEGLGDQLPSTWAVRGFGNGSAWEEDFKRSALGGTENSYVDDADLVYFAGHGSSSFDSTWSRTARNAMFTRTDRDDQYLTPGDALDAWGTGNMEWLAFASCQTMNDDAYWSTAMNRAHLIMGWRTNMADVTMGIDFAKNAIDSGLFDSAKTVLSSWFDAAEKHHGSGYTAIVIGENAAMGNDYLWGQGFVNPDPTVDCCYNWWTLNTGPGGKNAQGQPIDYSGVDAGGADMLNHRAQPRIDAAKARVFDARATGGLRIAVAPEVLDAHKGNPILQTFDIVPAGFEIQDLRTVADKICSNTGILCDADFGIADDGTLIATDGRIELSIDPTTGAPTLVDTALYLSDRDPGQLPSPGNASEIAAQFLRVADLLPSDGSVRSVTTLFRGGSDRNGEPSERTIALHHNVLFQRNLNNLPVFGPGGELTVSVGDEGQILRTNRNCWAPVRPGKEVELLPAQVIIQALAELPSLVAIDGFTPVASDIQIDKLELGYYATECGRGLPLIRPVYNMLITVFELSPEGDRSVSTFEVNAYADALPAVASIKSDVKDCVNPGETVCFEVDLQGGTPPFTAQWSDSSAGHVGTDARVCFVVPPFVDQSSNTGDDKADPTKPDEDLRTVSVVITDADGTRTTASVEYTVCAQTQPCPADFNGDTVPGDIFDLFDFLAALDNGLDFNGDTTPADIFDLFDFLAVLDAGCP